MLPFQAASRAALDPQLVALHAGKLCCGLFLVSLLRRHVLQHLEPWFRAHLAGLDTPSPVVENLEAHDLLRGGLCGVRFGVSVEAYFPSRGIRFLATPRVQDIP